MTKRFSFDYKGMKVKAIRNAKNEVTVDDVSISAGGRTFALADLTWNDGVELMLAKVETAARKEAKKLVQSGRL